jgi:hypothetical protein
MQMADIYPSAELLAETSEIWRPIEGYDGFYEVSSFGRVRSLPRVLEIKNRWGGISRHEKPGKILTSCCSSSGYFLVVLYGENRKGKSANVHQLVAEAFICKTPVGMQVAHNNGRRENNRLTNLRIATKESNYRDRDNHGTTPKGEKVGTSKLRDCDIAEIRRLKGVVPQRKIAERFGVSQFCIGSIHRGKAWRHV